MASSAKSAKAISLRFPVAIEIHAMIAVIRSNAPKAKMREGFISLQCGWRNKKLSGPGFEPGTSRFPRGS